MAFVNTRTARGTPADADTLGSYAALVNWARDAGVLAPSAAEQLHASARRRPAEAARALARACGLREALHDLFTDVAAGGVPPARRLSDLATHLAPAYGTARLVPSDGRLEWAPGPVTGLESVARELARAAARLVTSPSLARVRACAADDCRWWFVDDTRNHSRRWCEMKTCGNRAKLRRFRAREVR